MAIILTDDPLQKQQAAKQAALASFNPGQPISPSPLQSNINAQNQTPPVPQQQVQPGATVMGRGFTAPPKDTSMDWMKNLNATPAPKPAAPVTPAAAYSQPAQQPRPPVPAANPASGTGGISGLPQNNPSQPKPFNNPFANVDWSGFFKNLGSKTAAPAAIPTATSPNKSK